MSSTGAGSTTIEAGAGDSAAGGLRAGFEEAARITRERARNFYYGLRLTKEPRRSALYTVYAWMRVGDDCADSEGSVVERRARLAAHAARTARELGWADGHGDRGGAGGGGEEGVVRASDAGAIETEEGAGAYWGAFADTVRRYGLKREWIESMLAGLEGDIEPREVRTVGELDAYCYRVAGTVGLCCVSIWGVRAGAEWERVREKAEARGRAYQLTNILRDFAEDFDASPSRVYLPTEVFERFGVTAASVREWAEAQRCAALVRWHAERARSFFEASKGLERMVEPGSGGGAAMWAMTRIYEGILERVLRRPEAVVGRERVRLPAYRKAAIALAARLGAAG